MRRLVWVNLLTLVSGALVLATGLARIAWGVKGSAWYWGQPLLHAKITLLVMMLGLALLRGSVTCAGARRWTRRAACRPRPICAVRAAWSCGPRT